MKCSRRIRPIVSTTSIPHRPLHAKAGSRTNRKLGGQFWTPIPASGGHFSTPDHIRGSALKVLNASMSPSRAWRRWGAEQRLIPPPGGLTRADRMAGDDIAERDKFIEPLVGHPLAIA